MSPDPKFFVSNQIDPEESPSKASNKELEDKRHLQISVLFDCIFIDIISLNSYRCITELEKINLVIDNGVSEQITLMENTETFKVQKTTNSIKVALTNSSVFITNDKEAVAMKDCFRNIWLPKFQQLIYIPNVKVKFRSSVDENSNENFEIKVVIERQENNPCKFPSTSSLNKIFHF